MLTRADLNNNRPLAPIEAPTPVAAGTDARQEIYHRLSQIPIGKLLQADVLSMLEDGTFLVKVADTTARMNLPVGTKVGDAIPMTMVAKEPRPTFLLTPQTASAPASLSTTGRLIDHILQMAQKDAAPAAVVPKAPLLPSPVIVNSNPQQVATALHESIAQSGVFYESHVQEWAAGARPLESLVKEPQTQLETPIHIPPRGLPVPEEGKPAPPGEIGKAKPGTEGGKVPEQLKTGLAQFTSNMGELAHGVRSLIDLIQEAQMKVANNPAIDAVAITQPEVLPQVEPEAARLINLQLNTLEHQQLRWQGELWPGQKMEWEVSQDPPQGKNERGEQQQSWTSVVRFELPTLGAISATIRLSGERVQVHVNASDEAVVSTLRAHGGELAAALEAAGSPLDSLTVKSDGQA